MDLCDLDALKWQALGQDGDGLRGWLHRTEARRLLPLELELAAEADLVLVSTRQEAQDLAARGDPRRLEVLTNGVSWESFDALPAPSQVPPVVGFLGQMDYPPNVQAACHLAREVMPRVRARMPAARLAILGRAPSPDVRALADDHVTVAGEVASVPEALAGVAVFVAPLDKGRGIPNKILEALAAGRATVVSEWSARALSGEPGRDYLVVDGVEERAETVAALLADGARCDALGAAGRAYVREHHDWGRVLDRLEGLVREVTGA
jgi:glycosyltransferase involved in cell wall biosynthesis